MSKSKFIILLAMLCLLVGTIASGKYNEVKRSDLNSCEVIITDIDRVNYFRWSNMNSNTLELDLIGSENRSDEKTVYCKNSFWRSNNLYFTRTAVAKNGKVYLVLSIRHTSNDVYSCVDDSNYFYVASAFPKEIIFEKYDVDLNLESKNTLPSEKGLTLPNQIISFEDELYLLVAVLPNGSKYGTVENRLWQMDKDFNLLSAIDLHFYDGGYTQMTRIDNKLYISQTTQGIQPSGDAGPGNQIVIYDLLNATIDSEAITLTTEYPKDILFDDSSDSLIVFHDYTRLNDYAWTIVNLNSGEHSILNSEILGFQFNDYRLRPYFTVHKSICYILLDNRLISYDLINKSIQSISLEKFGIETAHNIIFKESN